jgi:chaperonin GroES
MNLEPTEDRLVVKADEAEDQRPSGLYLPEGAKEKPTEGTVLAVGPGHLTPEGKTIPLKFEVGDKVIYSKYSGTEVTVEGEDVLVISSRDILATLAKG